MERNLMIAGSYPTIITSGGNPRVNKDLVDNVFLRKYVSIFGELLKRKSNLGDIKILYLGGYTNEDNISRAKLYISAYNYFLNSLGYESLNKSNLTVVDIDNVDEALESIEQCDFLFLGIGADGKVASTMGELEKRGIRLNELIREKNLFVSSICSGSVMSAEMIFGGEYDNYYYDKEQFNYPFNIDSLRINPVTMETDFCPNDATLEKNEIFIRDYLKPDSRSCVFFACKPNSLFLIGTDRVYSYGEIYLFVDGECIQIGGEFDKVDVTILVELVNEYNRLKKKTEVLDNVMLARIKAAVQSLVRTSIEEDFDKDEQNIFSEFVTKEQNVKSTRSEYVEEWKRDLKDKIDSLFSDESLLSFSEDKNSQKTYEKLSDEVVSSYNVAREGNYLNELFLKMNLISLIKRSFIDYKGYLSDFRRDLYELLCEYIAIDDRVAYYAVDTCGSLFSNRELKQILNAIKRENSRRPQQIINSTERQLNLFRREIKYARS